MAQNKCFDAWNNVLKEWRENGGGLKDSLAETRTQIASDTKSHFSHLVRSIWAVQKPRSPSTSLGTWPVEQSERRSVDIYLGVGIESLVPEDCQSYVWLGPLLWDELVQERADTVTERKLREAPEGMSWDPHTFSSWAIYWLLVRLQ
jgi:hypothetical protein